MASATTKTDRQDAPSTSAKSAAARAAASGHAENGDTTAGTSNTATNGAAPQNGQPAVLRHPRRRTAEHLAAAQRDISVSEFFAKNRHLLGFDNPRKALLTTVKEAVDNALDACEEAGIIPEVWVRVAETGTNRYKVTVQDNGPGIVSKQIPLIFGKLLYGSKFHRLRMSRGQQGIGISAAGMYGVMTTGQPVRIVSKTSARKPAHYFEIQIDTKKNKPEILNGKGEGVDIPAGERGKDLMARHGIEWPEGIEHGTRVTIELEARFQRGRGSVDEYLEQTAIANPHARLHYGDAEGQARTYERSTDHLPPEPKEIKPHPYGVELGMLALMARDTGAATMAQFLTGSFSRVSPLVARNICEKAKLSIRTRPAKLTREEVEAVYRAIEVTKITAPSMDCLVPIGEELLLKGLRQVVPGQFYAAATRPPAVYRGNPFLIEVALAYGGASAATKVSREALKELLAESDARTLRQFLAMTFAGMGTEGADKIVRAANLATRQTPGKLKPKEIDALYESIQNVNLDEGQTMTVMRFANRVPLQFQQGACAITQTLMGTNWRAYGLAQSRGSLPSGPVTVMVHIASVWVPFTSESKEAVASYPEIQREIRLALQAVGRKLGMYVRRKERVQSQGERRNVFLRYIGEVSRAVGEMTGEDHEALYNRLFEVAKRKTAEADVQLDDRGRPLEQGEEDFGGSVLIVEEPSTAPAAAAAPPAAPESAEPKKK